MDKLTWNLDELFSSEEAFYQEIDVLTEKTENIKRFKDIDFTADTLLTALNEMQYIKGKTRYVLIYGSLRYYGDVKNEHCIELKDVAEKFNNQIMEELKFIDNKIISLGEESIAEMFNLNPELRPFSHYINNIFRLRIHVQNDDVNRQIRNCLDNINGSIKKYNALITNIDYGFINDGDKEVKITSQNFPKYAAARDRNIRHDTFFAVNNATKALENELAEILNTIITERVKISDLEQYDSVLEKTLFDENIDIQIIDSLIKAVSDNLHLTQKYLKLKYEYIGVTDPHLFDLTVPFDSNMKIKYSLEEATDIIKNVLKPLGNEYVDVIEHLLENGHFDAQANEQKHQSIIFSWFVYSFMNYRETYGDLLNMIHELGHITNHYLSHQKQPYLYEDSTTFVGETASIVNEVLLNQYLYENAETDEEKIFYLYKKIESFFSSVVRSTMFTEYENIIYNAVRDGGSLTAEFLNQNFLELLKKYYGNDYIYDEENGIEWARTGQLFRWHYNRYKYATGLLIANCVVNEIVNEQTLTTEEFLEFLSSGSSEYPLDLLDYLKIDLNDSKIINRGFNIFANDIEELEKVLTKVKKGKKENENL